MIATQLITPEIAQAIQCFITDVDGVLTDGRLYYGPDGEYLKAFHVLDGMGLKQLMATGLKVGVISGRQCPALEKRLDDLGITTRALGMHNKMEAYQTMLDTWSLTPNQTAYMGDDVNDLAVMQASRWAIAPANAVLTIREISHAVTTAYGGEGAVREACEALLTAQGHSTSLSTTYVGQQ